METATSPSRQVGLWFDLSPISERVCKQICILIASILFAMSTSGLSKADSCIVKAPKKWGIYLKDNLSTPDNQVYKYVRHNRRVTFSKVAEDQFGRLWAYLPSVINSEGRSDNGWVYRKFLQQCISAAVCREKKYQAVAGANTEDQSILLAKSKWKQCVTEDGQLGSEWSNWDDSSNKSIECSDGLSFADFVETSENRLIKHCGGRGDRNAAHICRVVAQPCRVR